MFDPYASRRPTFDQIVFYTGPIRAMFVVEPYLPDRVLRQFGLVQVIPSNPLALSRDQNIRGRDDATKRKRDEAEHVWTDGMWDHPDYFAVPSKKRIRATTPAQTVREYAAWFRSFAHPRVDVLRPVVTLDPTELRDQQINGVLAVVRRALDNRQMDECVAALEHVVEVLGSPSETDLQGC